MGKILDNKLKNIYEESTGVYRIELSNGFRDDGTRDRIVERVYGTEEEAIKRRDEMKANQKKLKEEGIKEQNSGYTLTQVAKIYLDDTKFQRRSVNTIRGYKQLLNNWILPNLGDIKIRSIQESDLEALYDKMRNSKNSITNKPLGETYISHCHKLIKSIYNYAKKKRWILTNPTDYVIHAPKFDTKERDYYSYDEMLNVYTLLENTNVRFKTAITILFNSGLRRGELFGLKWEDIDYRKMPIFENGKRLFQTNTIIKVNKEITTIEAKSIEPQNIIERITNSLVIIKPKTDKSVRNIVVANKCYDVLQEYKEYQTKNGFTPKSSDFIFRNEDFLSIWNPNNLTKEWKNFIENNDLKKITIHDIRHSHATYLLSLGIPPQDVARRLGHSEPATTLKIYTHSNLMQDQKIADMISKNVYYEYSKDNEKKDLSSMSIFSIVSDSTNLINKDELLSTLDWLSNTTINKDEENEYMEAVKAYLIDNNPLLESVSNIINKLDENDKEILLGGINLIFGNSNQLDLTPTEDINKYFNNIKI